MEAQLQVMHARSKNYRPLAKRLLCLPLCAVLSVAAATGLQAQEAEEPSNPELLEAIQAYAQDPAANHERLLEVVAEQGTDGMEGLALVVVGDAYMRSGDLQNARRFFDSALKKSEIAEAPEDNGWRGFAHMGLGMVDVSRGNMDGAYESFGLATENRSPVGPMAMLAAAQAAASMGKEQDALDLLEAVDELAESPPPVRDAARFARANMLLQKGEHEEAAALFDELAKSSEGSMARDAQYAAAQARLAAGDAEAAKGGFRSLVERCPAAEQEPDPKRTTRRLRELDSRSVLQAWVENYREASFESYVGSNATGPGGFAVDGCALARVTMEELEPNAPPIVVAQPEQPAAQAGAAQNVEPAAPAAEAVAPAPAAPAAAAPASERGFTWFVIAVGAVVLGLVVFALARRRA